jgi:GT2 family glycosyltransferase
MNADVRCEERRHARERGTIVVSSATIVVTLARFGPAEERALRRIVADARATGVPVIAVAYGSAGATLVGTNGDDLGITVTAANAGAAFGAAANAGSRVTTGEMLVFIDGAEPAGDGWLAALLDAARDANAGVIGPRIVTNGGANEACGIVVCSSPATPRGFDFQVFGGARMRFACDALPSDVLVTPRALFDELGGFDETIGGTFASPDYCLRAGERGRTVVCEAAIAFARLAPPDTSGQPAPGDAAFDARWRGRVEPHENFWPELTGSIARTEFYRDGVLAERVPIPKVGLMLYGAAPPDSLVARLSSARMRPASATWADDAAAVRTARQLTELRGPDYVAFMRTDTQLRDDWLNELVNAIERGPDVAAAVVADPPDARCTLVAPRRIPQHLRIEPGPSFDASVAEWLRAAERSGRTIARVRRTTTVVGPPGAGVRRGPAAATEPAEPFVSIVMLSWNAPEFTEIAVASIRERTRIAHEIIIVDNGSDAETLARLRAIPDIRLVENAVNTGFAFGCNQGLAAARGTHVVLLNNDVVVAEEWLEPLLAVQQRHPTIGCSAPRSNEVAGQQKLDVPYRELADMPAFAAERAREQRGRFTYQSRVIGLCMCLSRNVITEVGGLDPGYGTGNFEDDDYCMRIRAAGYEIAVCEDSFVHHFGSATFRANRVDYDATFARNMALFAQRWNVTFVDGSYDGRLPFRRGFVRERDYVPLPPPAGVGPGWVAARG